MSPFLYSLIITTPSPIYLSNTLTLEQIVDWNNGKAIASDKESEILKMLEQENSKE